MLNFMPDHSLSNKTMHSLYHFHILKIPILKKKMKNFERKHNNRCALHKFEVDNMS